MAMKADSENSHQEKIFADLDEMAPERQRRFKAFSIPSRMLLQVLRGEFVLNWSDMPEDAYVSQVHFSYELNGFYVIVTSRCFDPVPDHIQIPVFEPFLTHRPDRDQE